MLYVPRSDLRERSLPAGEDASVVRRRRFYDYSRLTWKFTLISPRPGMPGKLPQGRGVVKEALVCDCVRSFCLAVSWRAVPQAAGERTKAKPSLPATLFRASQDRPYSALRATKDRPRQVKAARACRTPNYGNGEAICVSVPQAPFALSVASVWASLSGAFRLGVVLGAGLRSRLLPSDSLWRVQVRCG